MSIRVDPASSVTRIVNDLQISNRKFENNCSPFQFLVNRKSIFVHPIFAMFAFNSPYKPQSFYKSVFQIQGTEIIQLHQIYNDIVVVRIFSFDISL